MSFIAQKSGHLVRLLPSNVSALSHRGLCAYVDQRLEEGASRSTVKKELGVLRASLRLARRNELFDRDPAELLPELEDDYVPRTRFLSQWEMVALASVLPPFRMAHLAFIVASGARWGESLRAEESDVGEHYVRLRGTKTKASERVVPVVGPFRPLLEWAMANRPIAQSPKLFADWKNVRWDITRACQQLGIAPASPNDFRRTFASWLRASGVPPQTIGLAMGHTTSRMVELVYGRVTPDSLRKLLTT